MTKSKLAAWVENLAVLVAEHHGANRVDCKIKVGGKLVDSFYMEGGTFDLDASRGLVVAALNRPDIFDAILGFAATAQAKGGTRIAASTGEVVHDNGRVITPVPPTHDTDAA